MLLKRLTLHGFKTFAGRTVFEFHGGITAVIGPNGSGKSNLADAVRWVLGEASHTALRAKRTEDVIFAGSSSRPAMGMAEVSLTIDNGARLLDTDFAEVTITRRAYRDGESQYLINGARVRLKDVVELTAPLGGAYTVVGQGLVDAALSQRAEERRGLFEHAAGISAQQLKRAEAERRLAAAEANLIRLGDILAELTPHLRTLERQARQAGEAAAVQSQLTAGLRRLYGAQWRDLSAAATRAEAEAAAGQERLEGERATVAALEHERGAIRARTSAARTALEALRAERNSLNRDLAEALRRAAVAAERLTALRRGLEEGDGQAADAATRQAALATSQAAAARELDDLAAEQARARTALTEAERAATAAAQAAQAAEAEAARRRHALLTGAARLGALEADLARLHERREGLARAGEEAAAVQAHQAAERADRLARHAALDEEAAAAAVQAGALTAGIAAAAARLDALDARLTEDQARLARLDHELTAARARLEALSRLRESGAGLAAGARAVLAAARAGRLSGVLGSVATLIRAPAHLDTALEVALGGHLQDIAVEHWANAEAAIALLKHSGAGRATFQPLDTLRPARPLTPERAPGIVGPAAELVEYEARYAPLVASLLGRSLIVEDLATAQRLVRGGGGWTIVTLAGEITRPGGGVTGGAATRESGLLARERELRDLPRQVDRLSEERSRLSAERETALRERAAAAAEREELAAAQARLTRASDARAHALARLDADLRALDEAAVAADRRAAEAAARRQTLGQEIEAARVALQAAQAAQAAEQAALDGLAAAAEALTARRGQGAAAVADARAALARLEERQRAAAARQAALTAERDRLTAAIAAAAGRRAALERDLAAAAAEHARHTDAHQRLARALAAAEERATPLEAALTTDAARLDDLETRLSAAGAALRGLESAAGRAAVAAEHARGALAALAVRVEGELPGVDPESLPAGAPIEPRLETTIAGLRERLRRIGLVDPTVVEEHAATRERHAFLTREAADVEAAIRRLRATIAELDALMRARFAETFQAVNTAFGRAFGRLFNGGTARLVLTDEGETPGIDILAHPPGKRLQSLALLSGGERALTAVALLFAILEVNPSPFCLLDEVDAALDESNVARFRGLLADLSSRTQFVVVTHNRGTIEGADTLYGISMSGDGHSQVISLRLDPPAAGETARAADD